MIRNAIQLLLESAADKEAFDDDVTIICNYNSQAFKRAKMNGNPVEWH